MDDEVKGHPMLSFSNSNSFADTDPRTLPYVFQVLCASFWDGQAHG